MDITKLRPVKISPYSRDKIIFDFFPDVVNNDVDFLNNVQKLSNKEAPLHAGALCLYATSLITKVYESDPIALEPHYKERELSYINLIKSTPKHASLSDQEVATFAKNLIIKDIRNCFAHGQFDISFDVYTKKLFFVLRPNRKDFVTTEPIVISKKALVKANQNFLNQMSYKYSYAVKNMIRGAVDDRLNKALKEMILPTQMLKLTSYYLDNEILKQDVLYDPKLYYLLQYTLLSTAITYEQDDYYNIFGKCSNIFDTISLIRNSLAHDKYKFLDIAKKVNYEDHNRSLSETIVESTAKLLIASSQKQALCDLQKQNPSQSLEDIAKDFADIYDFFFGGHFALEELVNDYPKDENNTNEDDENNQ